MKNREKTYENIFFAIGVMVVIFMFLPLTAYGNPKKTQSQKAIISSITDIKPVEMEAVKRAQQMVSAKGRNVRIVATSPSVADICNRLDLDLVGICSSTVSKMPQRYKRATVIGTPMAPDMEKVSGVQPDWILSPGSLKSDLQPKYEAIQSQWAFLNLDSVQGMYKSIYELGIIFGREKQAEKLLKDYGKTYGDIAQRSEGKKKPRVLILMGLPGSYIIATNKSYIGNLVEIAGGENVYQDSKKAFLTVNTEDIKKQNPDVILRTAHAMPDEVVNMFDKEFKTNSIWKHFDAVKKGKVYDLSYKNCGMSANFRYVYALEEINTMIFAETKKEINKAKKMSENAAKKSRDSKGKEKYDKSKKGEK